MAEGSSIRELIEKARRLVEEEKRIMKTLYQLAFIATSNSPRAEEAVRLIQEMMAKGLVSPKQAAKALEDVRRWRKIRFRFTRDMEYESVEENNNNGQDNYNYGVVEQ